jgi:MFS family permease
MASLPPPPSEERWRPRWLLAAPFLGRTPALTRRQWRVLGLVSAAALFHQYDRALLALALPRIQEGLAIAESEVGYFASIIQFGALPAFVIALAADHAGRRRVLLFTVVACAILTGATALAPDARSFVALQFLARAFTNAEVLLAAVVLSEELDPDVRGWGIGALFAIQACGVGVAALLLPLAGLFDEGWRVLYAVGVVPLLLIARWRRTLPETERFEEHRRRREAAPVVETRLAPLLALMRAYPGRLAALAAMEFVFSAGGSAADFFGPKYLQDAHGWAPQWLTLLYLAGGLLAVAGSVRAGRLSDRLGRRPVCIGLGVTVILLAIAFYQAGGWLLAPLWIALITCVLGHDVLLVTYGSELFPTSHRSTAAGARLVVSTLGAALGLAAESVLYGILGSHWDAIAVLLLFALIGPLIVAAAFPETAGRGLEEIAPERELRASGAQREPVPVPLPVLETRPEETP